MSKINCVNYDLDLFFGIGPIMFHTATAGGYVAEELFSNSVNRETRAKLKDKNNDLIFEYKINPYLDEILSLKYESQGIKFGTFDRESYLNDFIEYVKRGVFSFDRTFISDPFNQKYHLVAYPLIDEKYQKFIDKFFEYKFQIDNPYELFNTANDFIHRELNKPIDLFLF